jgi:hypothetical protein
VGRSLHYYLSPVCPLREELLQLSIPLKPLPPHLYYESRSPGKKYDPANPLPPLASLAQWVAESLPDPVTGPVFRPKNSPKPLPWWAAEEARKLLQSLYAKDLGPGWGDVRRRAYGLKLLATLLNWRGLRPPTLHQSVAALDRKGRGLDWQLKVDLGKALRQQSPETVATALEKGLRRHPRVEGARHWSRAVATALQEGWLVLGHRPPEGLLNAMASGSPLPMLGPTPVGAPLVELLLAPLDAWCQRQMTQGHAAKRRRQTPAYSRLMRVRQYLLTHPELTVMPATYQNGHKVPKADVGLSLADVERKKMEKPSYDPEDPNFSRVLYLRHGSMLLLGVAGDRQLLDRQVRGLRKVLAQKCGLYPSFSRTPYPFKKPFSWVGFMVKASAKRSVPKIRADGTRRMVAIRLIFNAPLKALRHWLVLGGVLKVKQLPTWRGFYWKPYRHPMLRQLTEVEERLARYHLRRTLQFFYQGMRNHKPVLYLMRSLELQERAMDAYWWQWRPEGPYLFPDGSTLDPPPSVLGTNASLRPRKKALRETNHLSNIMGLPPFPLGMVAPRGSLKRFLKIPLPHPDFGQTPPED